MFSFDIAYILLAEDINVPKLNILKMIVVIKSINSYTRLFINWIPLTSNELFGDKGMSHCNVKSSKCHGIQQGK